MEFFVNIWQNLFGLVTQAGAWAGDFLWAYGRDMLMILVILGLAFLLGWMKSSK